MTIRAIGPWDEDIFVLLEQSWVARRREDRERIAAEQRRRALEKTTADPRQALREAAVARGDSLAALSRMLGRSDGYLQRFISDGVPQALSPDDHRRLADYFGRPERGLGIRDLWCRRG